MLVFDSIVIYYLESLVTHPFQKATGKTNFWLKFVSDIIVCISSVVLAVRGNGHALIFAALILGRNSSTSMEEEEDLAFQMVEMGVSDPVRHDYTCVAFRTMFFAASVFGICGTFVGSTSHGMTLCSTLTTLHYYLAVCRPLPRSQERIREYSASPSPVESSAR